MKESSTNLTTIAKASPSLVVHVDDWYGSIGYFWLDIIMFLWVTDGYKVTHMTSVC